MPNRHLTACTRLTVAIIAIGLTLAGCNRNNSGGGGSPTGPTPSVTAITVNGNPDIARGSGRTFTATAMTSGGGSQAVTGGTWGTDNPAVMQITADGAATAVGLGFATVFVDFQGVRGTLLMRVLQNFAGEYLGEYRVDSCAATGDWIAADGCGDPFAVGSELPLAFLFAQNGASLSGATALGTIVSNSFAASVREDGGVTITVTAIFSGVQFAETWELRADTTGRITGTLRFVITEPSLAGETAVTATIVDAILTLPTASVGRGPGRDVVDGSIRAFRDRLRQRLR